MQAKINSLTVHVDLLKSGFVPNKDKSLWEPVQIISWLGVHLNTLDGTIRATDERIAKLSHYLAALSSFKSSSAVHVKRVASVAGQIISLSSCLGSVARIMTRFLFSVVNSAVSWDSRFSCPMILCVKLNFGRTMFMSSTAKFIGGLLRFRSDLAAFAMLPIQHAALLWSPNLS